MCRALLTRGWAIGIVLAFVLLNGCVLQPGTAGPGTVGLLDDAGLDGSVADPQEGTGDCVAETDSAFCARLESDCGPLSGVDNCGAPRAVQDCGTCTPPATCGGGASAGACGFGVVDEKPRRRCVSETDAQFCARLGKDCGMLSGADNCHRARTIASCGACTAPETCGGAGASNVCGLPTSCGNGAAEAGEVCDGADLRSATCVSRGFASGTLACLADCSAFDPSGCAAGVGTPILPATLAAFPGCQGAGCYTRGGFNTSAGTPTIYRVTSLSNGTEAGTLGACLTASGPRVCTFAVAGTIHAPNAGYVISSPYVTVRGDTAPGQGVNVDFNGTGSSSVNLLSIQTHDVVVRGLRFRHGHPNVNSNDTIELMPTSTVGTGALNHIVLDHMSANWGADECLSIVTPGGLYERDITISYSLIGEGMSSGERSGSKGAMSAAYTATDAKAVLDIDWHHNFITNNERRFPEQRNDGSTRLVNNIINHWGNDMMSLQNGIHGDLIGNMGRPGVLTSWSVMFWVGYSDANYTDTRRQSVYMDGNKKYGGPVQGWGTGIVYESSGTDFGLPEHRATPLPPAASGPAIVAENVDNLPTSVAGAGGAGHSQRLDCGGAWVRSGVRDSLENRLLGEFFSPPASYPGTKTCSGVYCWPLTVAETPSRGYPVIASIASSTVCSPSSRDNTSCVCADSDSDGMPDYWERAFCGAASGTGSCAALSTSLAPPWTNIEAFQSGSVVAP